MGRARHGRAYPKGRDLSGRPVPAKSADREPVVGHDRDDHAERRVRGSGGPWRELFVRREFRELKRLLAQEDLNPLRQVWLGLEPMEKAVLFKLMDNQAAMEFYAKLPFSEKYFLFTAFDPGVIAPITEDLDPRLRSLFHRLPEECYEEMLRRLK